MIWDETLKYHIYGGENVPDSPKNRTESELKKIAFDIFKEKNERSSSELVQELCLRLGVKERTGKKYVEQLIKSEIVIRSNQFGICSIKSNRS